MRLGLHTTADSVDTKELLALGLSSAQLATVGRMDAAMASRATKVDMLATRHDGKFRPGALHRILILHEMRGCTYVRA